MVTSLLPSLGPYVGLYFVMTTLCKFLKICQAHHQHTFNDVQFMKKNTVKRKCEGSECVWEREDSKMSETAIYYFVKMNEEAWAMSGTFNSLWSTLWWLSISVKTRSAWCIAWVVVCGWGGLCTWMLGFFKLRIFVLCDILYLWGGGKRCPFSAVH